MARNHATPAAASRPDPEEAYGTGLPFRRRLLLGALLAGLVLVCTAGGLAWHQYDDAQQSALDDARARVLLASALVDTYFGGELATLSVAGAVPAGPGAGRPAAMSAYFKRVQPRQGRRVRGRHRLDRREGRLPRLEHRPGALGLDVVRPLVLQGRDATGTPFVSEGLPRAARNRHIIVMAVPTRDAGGR